MKAVAVILYGDCKTKHARICFNRFSKEFPSYGGISIVIHGDGISYRELTKISQLPHVDEIFPIVASGNSLIMTISLKDESEDRRGVMSSLEDVLLFIEQSDNLQQNAIETALSVRNRKMYLERIIHEIKEKEAAV